MLCISFSTLTERFRDRMLALKDWRDKCISEVRVVDALETNFGGSNDDKTVIVLAFTDGTISEPFVLMRDRSFNDLTLEGVAKAGIISDDELATLQKETQEKQARAHRENELLERRSKLQREVFRKRSSSSETKSKLRELASIEDELEEEFGVELEGSKYGIIGSALKL